MILKNMSVYLKHIKVIYRNPVALIGKKIVAIFPIDDHSFFFKDEKLNIYFYCSFLTDREVLPGLSLDKNSTMIGGIERHKEKLYLYPSVYEGNILDKTTESYLWIKEAFNFGIFNDKIKKEFIKNLKTSYEEHLIWKIKNAKEQLQVAKKNLNDYNKRY